jgi:fermentation-respiration switch protein FrsA (DUF1100 family)
MTQQKALTEVSVRHVGARAAMICCALAGVTACAFVANPARERVPAPPAALGAQDVSFLSPSGSRIAAWLARGRRGAGAVLLLHGVGSNRTSMESRARFLHDEGFTVLALDFEGHGESTGEMVTYGARESLDASAAMDFLKRAAPNERIGVLGVSMGGAATLLGSGPLPADAYVLESVYPTIRQAVANRLGAWLGPVGGLGRLFTSPVLKMIHSKTGVNERDLRPIARIGDLHGPLLLIAGTADRYTPLAESESLFAHAPDPKTFWAVEGADHEDLHDFTPAEYEQRVSAFLTEYLRH